jgi:Cytochrome P460
MLGWAGWLTLFALLVLAPLAAQNSEEPRYSADGQLVLPTNYREWTFLSSGFGMSYNPPAGHGASPAFLNVFVNPAAYRSFVTKGTWPARTMLVLEVRASASKGSIIRDGYYQSDLLAVEGEVKDSSRFPGNGWAFFAFGKASTGKLEPRTQDCYSCHAQHGAVDNTFVQFYPALLEIAKRKGTLKDGR